MFKATKIGATIGPACDKTETIVKMIKAGMNFARLNFSHGTFETHRAMIRAIRAAEKETGEPTPILVDLQGPRIRIGTLSEEGIKIETGQTAHFGPGNGEIPLDYPELSRYVKPGETILIDDGRIEVKVVTINGGTIEAAVVVGGVVRSHKGINLPDTSLPIPVLSEKDKDDIRFAVEEEVDCIGLSFVAKPEDILDVRALISEHRATTGKETEYEIAVIAKIERHEAVENLEKIIAVSDGIMVARGDLGLELPKQDVPLIQKRIIDLCNTAAIPVIVATQLLDSMRENARPTRAEVSDVANAVIDHTDALLLTNETAAGAYPVETVQTMSEIIVATEKSPYDDKPLAVSPKKEQATERAISALSNVLAQEVGAKLILAASLTGETGRLISSVRPELPIVVATQSVTVWRQLNITWGVKSFIMLPCKTIEELVERALEHIKRHQLAKIGEKMIIVAGEPVGTAGNVNLVEVREVV